MLKFAKTLLLLSASFVLVSSFFVLSHDYREKRRIENYYEEIFYDYYCYKIDPKISCPDWSLKKYEKAKGMAFRDGYKYAEIELMLNRAKSRASVIVYPGEECFVSEDAEFVFISPKESG